MNVVYSQVATQFLLEIVNKDFSIPLNSKISFLHQGFNDTYEIETATDTYILRIYRANRKTYEEIKAELSLLNLIHSNGASVSTALFNKSGDQVGKIGYPEGIRYYVLFTYAEGNSIQKLHEESAYLMGKSLAEIHLITEGQNIKNLSNHYAIKDILDSNKAISDYRLKEERDIKGKLLEVIVGIDSILTTINNEDLSLGICHGDPHYENCHLNHSSKTVTFFDFDLASNGYLLYDLGAFYHYERERQENQKSFLTGYNEIKPLTTEEIDMIPYFTLLMRLFHLKSRLAYADGTINPRWRTELIENTIDDIFKQFRENY